ncbi:hypothetical protein C2S51_006780 [Perilla frutescens var. frutescens]|nr:hypothetical protein C2S51_006780 [Perilla frutescens var. frutescens]
MMRVVVLSGHHRQPPDKNFWFRPCIQDLDHITNKVMEVKEKWRFKEEQPADLTPSSTSSKPHESRIDSVVGFDEVSIQLMSILTAQKPSRQVIPVVGMGGIGKTTLVRNVYENLLIVQYFDVRAWATISQEYSVKDILIQLLSCQRDSNSETVDELGERLYKSLLGRRYLIILDDMWSIEVWDKMKFFFPDKGNRSRIVITTRLSNMAMHISSLSFVMNFLDEDKSWDLFCHRVFGEDDCPPTLEEVGKKIAEQCKGLPLSIVTIGGLLRKSDRTIGYWQNVAKNINLIMKWEEKEQCLNVLSLSYSYLPPRLKPCFLYLGIFKEDHEIRVSELIKLWIAEGFIKPTEGQTLEEVAEGCLQDLVERNLVLVRRFGSMGRIRSCGIHDLVRELCLTVAEKEKLLHLMTSPTIPDKGRRFVFHRGIPSEKRRNVLQSATLARSLLCSREREREGVIMPFTFPLLRVLKDADVSSLEAAFQQVNLRYLDCLHLDRRIFDCLHHYQLPPSISLLWNLQTLIVRSASARFHAPSEMWEMPQLRHLEAYEVSLPDPPPTQQHNPLLIMRNLHTLSEVVNFRWSDEACRRIPNIKKLSIKYELWSMENSSTYYCLNNLGLLQKLETLDFHLSPGCSENWGDLMQSLTLPSSLKKLCLRYCKLDGAKLRMIGLLPFLEVLKLEATSVGYVWKPVEGEFLRLKYLKMKCCNDLLAWKAGRSHFPVLEQLVLRGTWGLDEIPSGMGEIATLGSISVEYCNYEMAFSAMKLLEEQDSLGNEELRVRVRMNNLDVERFREIVEVESYNLKNFQLVVDHVGGT